MPRLWPSAAGIGLLAGVLLEVATFLVARYGPSGGESASWSFRGNGALVVPFGLGPALVAGGWTAIVLHDRAVRRWLRGGVFAALVGAVLALADAVSVTLPGEAAVLGIQVLTLLLLVWMLVAPVLARFWPLPPGSVSAESGSPGERGSEIMAHLAAGVAFPVALVIAFVLATALLPPGS